MLQEPEKSQPQGQATEYSSVDLTPSPELVAESTVNIKNQVVPIDILHSSEPYKGYLAGFQESLAGQQENHTVSQKNLISSLRLNQLSPGYISYSTGQYYELPYRSLTLTKPIFSAFKDDYAKKAELQLGFHLTPSVIFYDQTPNNQAYSAEFSFNYTRSSVSIRSGIGAGYLQDKGSYKIIFETYDSVGYFLNITSFTIDQGNPGNVTFDFEREAVYDSVPHYELTEKSNSYLYLDVPISVGYNFYHRKRISLGIYAGAKLSFLLYRNEPTVEFSGPPSELITIERQVPARMSTNLRLTAGLDFGYLLTDKVSFHLEPLFEQYINSVYMKQPGFSSGKPYIIGLRAGILFNF
jgi:hypothetical protein